MEFLISGAFWGEEKRFICKWKVIFFNPKTPAFCDAQFHGEIFYFKLFETENELSIFVRIFAYSDSVLHQRWIFLGK